MKTRQLTFIVLSLALVLSAIAMLAFGVSHAAAAEGDTDEVRYTYTAGETIVIEPTDSYEPIKRQTSYYVDDITNGWGNFTQSLYLPESFEVSASVDSPRIMEAVAQIVSDIQFPATNASCYSTIDIVAPGYEQQLSETSYSSYTTAAATANLNDGITSIVLSATDRFSLEGTLCIRLVVSDRASSTTIKIYFKLTPTVIEPLTAGSLISLNSTYSLDSDNAVENVSFSVAAKENVFSTDPNATCYKVEGIEYRNLPSSSFTMTLIYDGKLAIAGTQYLFENQSLQDEPYTVQGRLDFTDTAGDDHTLYTNVITIEKHSLEMRIDRTNDFRVGAGVEHEYSFIFDDNIHDDLVIDEYYLFNDELTNYYFNPGTMNASISFADIGTVTLRFRLRVYFNDGYQCAILENVKFTIQVLAEQPVIVPPDYKITFSYPEGAAVLLGGTEFEVSASINEYFGDERFTTVMSVTGSSVGVLSTAADRLTLVPLTTGRSVLTFTAVSSTAGEFTDNIFLDVVASTAENTILTFDDSFALRGSDITASLTIDGYSTFLNCSPTWRVQMESGEEMVDVDFIVDAYGSATVEDAAVGYYHFTVSGVNLATVTGVKRVASINMQEIASTLLPFLAPIMVAGFVLAIILRHAAKKRRTLYHHLVKVSNMIGGFLGEKTTAAAFPKRLLKINRGLRKCLAAAEIRDQETLGQFNNVCELTSRAIQICTAARTNRKRLNNRQMEKFLRFMKKQYVDKAARICAELDDSLEQFAHIKAVAVTTVPKDKIEAEKPIDYMNMMKSYDRAGDIVDANGRSGDDDR